MKPLTMTDESLSTTENVVYSEEDLNEFRRLVELGESRNQMDRIHSRLDMPKFVKKHGKAKCDAMFEVLKQELQR